MDGNNGGNNSATTILVTVVIILIIGLAFYFGFYNRGANNAVPSGGVNVELNAPDLGGGNGAQ